MKFTLHAKSEKESMMCIYTLDRRQMEALLAIDKHRSKIARNSVFDCHLSQVGLDFC